MIVQCGKRLQEKLAELQISFLSAQ